MSAALRGRRSSLSSSSVGPALRAEHALASSLIDPISSGPRWASCSICRSSSLSDFLSDLSFPNCPAIWRAHSRAGLSATPAAMRSACICLPMSLVRVPICPASADSKISEVRQARFWLCEEMRRRSASPSARFLVGRCRHGSDWRADSWSGCATGRNGTWCSPGRIGAATGVRGLRGQVRAGHS